MAANTANKNDEVLGIKGFKESKHYEQVRPDYPREGVELLLNKLGLIGENSDKTRQLTVLELGAGTGKFTRVMAEVLQNANVRIIASDPVKEMCEQFKEMQPDIEIRQFGAEDIDLPDGSVDVVIAATCFHWFAYKQNAISQIHRVLNPKGMLGVAWLIPDKESQPFVYKVMEYILPFFTEKPCLHIDFEEENVVNQIGLSEKFSQSEKATLINHDKCNREQFYQSTLSYSAVQAMTEEERSDFTTFCREAMAEHVAQTGREITSLAHRVALYWSKRI